MLKSEFCVEQFNNNQKQFIMIKKLLFSVAVIATNFMMGQMTVAFSGSSVITSDGTFRNAGDTADESLILIVDNIPLSASFTPVVGTIHFRLQASGTTGSALTGTGLIDNWQFTGTSVMNLDTNESDVIDANISFVTVDGTLANTKKRTYTIKTLGGAADFTSLTGDGDFTCLLTYRVSHTGDPKDASALWSSPEALTNGNSRIAYTNSITILEAPVASIDLDKINAIGVFPNPTTGVVNISDISNIETITISNVLGQVVRTFGAQNSIDISDLKAGVYYLQADNGLKREIVKK